MKKRLFAVLLGGAIAMGGTGIVLANPSPNGPGQPSVDCADFSSGPAGFQTQGFANAESHYAGSDGTPSLAHANSSKPVAQYDVACLQVSSH